jgi:hypothetical protein
VRDEKRSDTCSSTVVSAAALSAPDANTATLLAELMTDSVSVTRAEAVEQAEGVKGALARALGIPHLAPVVQRVELIDVIESGPVEGNWADGERTAAFFQFDRVTIDDRVREATHVDSAKCDETAHMIRTFFGAWADGEVPVIDDPFIALGTGELVP